MKVLTSNISEHFHLTMMNFSIYSTTTTILENEKKISEKQRWLDIVLPVMGLALLSLLIATFSRNVRNMLIKCAYVCQCCGTRYNVNSTNTTQAAGNNRRNQQGRQDLPPSYSTAGVGHASHISFRVVADDVSDVLTMRPQASVDDIENLPSYLEFMQKTPHKGSELPSTIPSSLCSNNKNCVSVSPVVEWTCDSPVQSDEDESISDSILPPAYDTALSQENLQSNST